LKSIFQCHKQRGTNRNEVWFIANLCHSLHSKCQTVRLSDWSYHDWFDWKMIGDNSHIIVVSTFHLIPFRAIQKVANSPVNSQWKQYVQNEVTDFVSWKHPECQNVSFLICGIISAEKQQIQIFANATLYRSRF
jgi:hypothetical protein